jgi:hypothetical protein
MPPSERNQLTDSIKKYRKPIDEYVSEMDKFYDFETSQ